MRLLPLFFILMLTAACGKQSSSGSSNPDFETAPSLHGMKEADGQGIDLLDVSIDVPIEIRGPEITFLASKKVQEVGRRISCGAAVNNGESYRYDLEGEYLRITTGQGSYRFRRLNNEKNGLLGAWTWKGVEDGHLVRRIFSFITDRRMIMKTYCEL